MQELDVAPGSLDPVAAALRAVDDGGATRLARAVVEDLIDGLGGDGSLADADDILSQVVDLLAQRTSGIGDRLSVAAGAYRRAEWLARLAMGDPR
ncbi:hypothetical protein [Flexivirga oryzae]|uniref:Uncharacterized protein n=1 Tax=Flexivirga oryzae TaxID=1794944 RepID=A0A839N6M4_9MICO|nr:hypothetical protein [Flexivirga oryzae]MBB2890865.1 hypothetical protein [Flexivirga oryzae]